MKFFKTIKRKFRTLSDNPNLLLIKPLVFLSSLFSDRQYLKLLFPLKTGYKLNLENPQTYNEKLQWLKLYYRKPVLTTMVDKYEAKKFVAEIVGEEYVINNYGVWNSFEEINFDELPNEFVLKTTHDQGGVVICKDKKGFDHNNARKKLNKHLKFKHYYLSREWPYKNVTPRIIAEELLIDSKNNDIWDYKFYCFHGEPKVMYISMGRQDNHVPFYFYDMDFNLLDLNRPGHEHDNKQINKPNSWDLMKTLARKLSANLPHVRVDFYDVNNKLQVGELTLFQGGGLMPFKPEKWDYTFGSWIDLDKVKDK